MAQVFGTTLYLAWEDISEVLACGESLRLPEGVTKVAFDTDAIHQMKPVIDGEDNDFEMEE